MLYLLQLECLLNMNTVLCQYIAREEHSEQTIQLVNEVNMNLHYPLLLFTHWFVKVAGL